MRELKRGCARAAGVSEEALSGKAAHLKPERKVAYFMQKAGSAGEVFQVEKAASANVLMWR